MERVYEVPVVRSIVQAEALARVIEAEYEFEVVRIRLVKDLILGTYRVWTRQGPYVCRIYPVRRRSLVEIEEELDLLEFLHCHGARVSSAVRGAEGQRLFEIATPGGTRHAALFSWAEGEPLGENLKAIRNYGKELAKIHVSAEAFQSPPARPPRNLSMLLEQPMAHLEDFDPGRESWQDLRRIIGAISPAIDALGTLPPSYGYCHGDASSSNAHTDAEGNVTLFDFDFCGPGWRAYDLGAFLANEDTNAVELALLGGYESVRTLTEPERRALPLFKIAQRIWMLGVRADYISEWGDSYLSDGFIEHIVGAIRRDFAATG